MQMLKIKINDKTNEENLENSCVKLAYRKR